MSITFRTHAIPLVKRSVRETDRVYSVLTPDHGKLDLMAKGSRKIVSKLAGEMEHVGVLDLFVIRGRAFDRLGGAEAVRSFPEIRASYERLVATTSVSAFVDRAVRSGSRDRDLFDLLLEYLEAVAQASDQALADGRLAFAIQWKLFARLGFRPDLEKCVRCRTDVPEDASLTVRHGGLVCRECRASGIALDASTITHDQRKVLSFLLEAPLSESARLFLAPPLRAATATLTNAWSQMHLEMDFNHVSYA